MYAIIHPIEPFDSSIGTEIKFTWKGNQIYKARCIIKNNETGVTVYDHIEDTMKQSYTIPPNSGLQNGTYYVTYITVLDVNGNESDIQNIGTPFYCLSKPVFNLSVPNGGIIQTSTYRMGINYSQTQDEPLDSFSVTLYTYQKTVISSSGDIYDTPDMSYVISGLENAKQYYLRATGKTLHGINLDTGFILVTVSYTIAQVFNTLELNNKADSGAIEIKSNIVSAIGVSEKDVIYINGEQADLRDNSVTFDDGFEVKGDFTKVFVCSEPIRNKSIVSFGDGDKLKVDIYYREGSYSDSNGEKAYFELVVNSCGINHVVNSNYVDIVPNYYQYSVCVNRTGNYFDIKAVIVSNLIRYSPNANGSPMTETRQPNSQYVGVGYMPREIVEHENLYTGTKDFTGTWINKVLWTITPNGYENFSVASKGEAWYGLRKNIPALEGETYTFSATVRSATKEVYMYFILTATTNPTFVKFEIPIGEWTRINGTFVCTASGDIGCRVEAGSTSLLEACALKLERGTEATPWTPTPSEWIADPGNYEWKAL